MLADLKANPGQRSFGSPGNGSSPHLATEMMKAQTGTFAVHVPYRGAAPALTDLLGGQLDFLFDPGIASFEEAGGYRQSDATGFIALNGLRLRTRKLKQG